MSGNLVPRLDSFVGRTSERIGLAGLVHAHRLVTVVGPVGVGKTRLATEVAHALRFADGVWFVDLAAVHDPGHVDQAVATVIGTESRDGDARSALAAHLARRRALLVLDNCEHVIRRCADLVAWLLPRCPAVHVLATSREPLALPEEHRFPLAPLPIEPDAVRLFAERAAAVDHEFTVTAAVLDLCHDLDGLPLAIELAARRVRYLPTASLAGLLRGGERTASRHRSLDTAIAWSYDLLDPPEQVVLRRLSVLAGWFDASLAAAVCGVDDARDSLVRLAAKSLVVAEDGKFRLLEAIRLFGRDRLTEHDEVDATFDRLASWFADLLGTQTSRYQIDPDVVRTLHEQESSLAVVVAWAAKDARWPLLVWGLTFTWARHGHLVESAELLGGALHEHPPPAYESLLLTTLANIECWRGNTDEALDLGKRAVEIEESLGRRKRLARAHCVLGLTHETAMDTGGARYHHMKTLELLRQEDEPQSVGHTLFNLGSVALRQRDLTAAEGFLDEARHLMTTENTSPNMMASLWQTCGEFAIARGELDVAEHHFTESLRVGPDLPRQLAYGLSGLAVVAIGRGDDEHGLRLAESARAIQRGATAVVQRYWQEQVDVAVAAAEARLPEHRAAVARADGRQMSLDEAVAYALKGMRTKRSPLSDRQLAICRSVAKGQTDRQIARELGVSIRTVNTYLEEIRAALGVRNRAELAAWITRHDSA